jgi:hypothetical protein
VVKALTHIAATHNEHKKPELLDDPTLPPSLRRFICRGIAKCYTEQERDYIKMVLKQMVEMARSNNQLHTRDWDASDLPTLPRELLKPVIQQGANLMQNPSGFIRKIAAISPPPPVRTRPTQ